MFGIGENELIIILVFAFLLFGPDKLPGIGRTIGRVLRQFREASEGFTEVVQANVIDPATQELNNAGSNKRTPSAAQKPEADDDDADIEEEGSEAAPAEAPRKRETFAERKARLEAEKAAREAAAVAADDVADEGDADADVDVTGEPAPAAATDTGSEKAEPAEPPRPSVADLYARGSRRSSRAKAEDAKAEDAKAEDAEASERDVAEQTAATPEDAPAPQDSTEGEGGEADA